MKYDANIPAIANEAHRALDPLVKAMWLRRLGVIYYYHGDAFQAQRYFNEALLMNQNRLWITLNTYAVVCLEKKRDAQGLSLLNRSLQIKPIYPDTLRTLGIYYYRHRDFAQAIFFLNRALFFEPDQPQAKELLRLAKQAN